MRLLGRDGDEFPSRLWKQIGPVLRQPGCIAFASLDPGMDLRALYGVRDLADYDVIVTHGLGPPAMIKQRCIIPNVNVISVCEKPPTGRQCQVWDYEWAFVYKVIDAHRHKEIIGIGRFAAAPQIPAACIIFRFNSHAVEWMQPERVQGNSDSRSNKRRPKIRSMLVANISLFAIAHRNHPSFN
jgi:hypothetical protein